MLKYFLYYLFGFYNICKISIMIYWVVNIGFEEEEK